MSDNSNKWKVIIHTPLIKDLEITSQSLDLTKVCNPLVFSPKSHISISFTETQDASIMRSFFSSIISHRLPGKRTMLKLEHIVREMAHCNEFDVIPMAEWPLELTEFKLSNLMIESSRLPDNLISDFVDGEEDDVKELVIKYGLSNLNDFLNCVFDGYLHICLAKDVCPNMTVEQRLALIPLLRKGLFVGSLDSEDTVYLEDTSHPENETISIDLTGKVTRFVL